METRRLLIAVALSILVFVLFTTVWGPKPPPPGQERPEAIPVPVEEMVDESPTREVAEQDDPGTEEAPAEPLPEVGASIETTVLVETDVYVVELTNRGGLATSWALTRYTSSDGVPLEVWPQFREDDALPLALDLDDRRLADALNDALYEVERASLTTDVGPAERVSFAYADGRGVEARKAFTFYRDRYLVDVDLEVVDRDRVVETRLALGPGFAAQESGDGRSNYYYASQAVWNFRGQVERTGRKELAKAGATGLAGNQLRWAGLEDQYFAALVLPGEGPADIRIQTVERNPIDGEAEEPIVEPIVGVSIASTGGQLFVGPKNYRMLEDLGSELEKSIYFSRFSSLAWISRQIYLGLLWIHDNVAPNYGLAIVLATMVLRILLFPVNQYSMVQMKKSQLQMQRLQPKVKQIRNKYKKAKDAQSRAKMNTEMMDLYKREGVNPMGGVTGCLPLFAQFPILIGFYNMLTVAVELKGAPFFGWIQDLSLEDPFYVTPLLMGVTMFAQQKMAMTKIKDPQQLQQQRIMLFMPVMFTFICIGLPSGLVLYWFVNNLLGIGQQWLVNRHTGRLEAAAQKA